MSSGFGSACAGTGVFLFCVVVGGCLGTSCLVWFWSVFLLVVICFVCFVLVVVVGILCVVIFVWLFFWLWGWLGLFFGVCWL